MNITKLPVDIRKLLKNAILVAISPTYEYKDGVRTTNIIGRKYTVLCPDLNYERINVKIPGVQQMDIGDEAIPVKFDEVEAKIYCIDGRYDVSVSAGSIAPAKTVAAGKQ